MRGFFIIGCLLGGLAVGLGAFGAHALKTIIGDYGLALWAKGTYYQMIHAMMIIITSLCMLQFQSQRFFLPASYFFLVGTLLFSGSLYAIALTNKGILGIIAPFGGLSFMLGWLLLLLGLAKHSKHFPNNPPHA